LRHSVVLYLVERRNKIPCSQDDEETAKRNWKRSKDQSAAMIKYVCSLRPLLLDDIKAIYEAEFTIGQLSELVLETLQCVAKDVSELERTKEEAEEMRTTVSSNPASFQPFCLETLRVPKSRIFCTEIGHWNLVCTGSKCVEVADGSVHYKQICCENCQGMQILGSFWCSNISLFLGQCKRCKCIPSKHRYTTTKTEVKTTMEKLVVTHETAESAEESINRAISECKHQINECEAEMKQMMRICVELNTYVTQNVLLALSDVDTLTKSLENRIETYESAVG